MRVKAEDLVQEKPDTPEGRIAQMLLWIAPHPEDVELNIAKGMRKILVEVDVHQDDMARVIGTGGRTINAVRTILYASLEERDYEYDVSLPDKDGRRGRRKKHHRQNAYSKDRKEGHEREEE